MELFNGYRDWLEWITGKDNSYWMSRVQTLIKVNSTEADETGHGDTDIHAVLSQLVDEISTIIPEANPRLGMELFDGNMWAFSVLSQVTTLWYSRVHFAKTYDPNRPVGNATKVYKDKYIPYVLGIQLTLMDQSRDSTYFPEQEWQNPFVPKPKSGKFL